MDSSKFAVAVVNPRRERIGEMNSCAEITPIANEHVFLQNGTKAVDHLVWRQSQHVSNLFLVTEATHHIADYCVVNCVRGVRSRLNDTIPIFVLFSERFAHRGDVSSWKLQNDVVVPAHQLRSELSLIPQVSIVDTDEKSNSEIWETICDLVCCKS